MEVELRVVLREESFELVLRAGPLHAVLVLVLVFSVTSKDHVLVLLEVAILKQGIVLLPEVWLTV